jgi:hypothetical protein
MSRKRGNKWYAGPGAQSGNRHESTDTRRKQERQRVRAMKQRQREQQQPHG